MSTRLATAALAAVERSARYNEIVTLHADNSAQMEAFIDELIAIADAADLEWDSVTEPSIAEVWAWDVTTEAPETEWRVHITWSKP